MTNELIQQIYDDLRQLGGCRSRNDFSTDWLGSNEAYYRTIQSRGESVSIRAQAHLAASLRSLGMAFVKSEFPQVRHKGTAMLNLYGICADDLFERVTLDAMSFEAD